MADKSLFIPETPQELTVGWLNEVLTEQLHDNEITALSQSVLGEGEGFVGDIIRLELTYAHPNPSLPQSIVAKMPKLANRAMGELLGAYERENMFYMTLGQALPVRSPKMYYGEFDRDAGSEKQEEILRQANKIPKFLQGLTNRLAWFISARKNRRYILLIEDIGGIEAHDQLAGVDRDAFTQILIDVAKLHADFWQDPRLQGQFWLLPMDIDIEMRHQMALRARGAYESLFPGVISDGMGVYLDQVATEGVSLSHQLCAGPMTLMHGDLRLDNLFFTGTETLFIDWQLVRRGPPMYDIAYLLSCGVPDDMPAQPLLEAYHAALVDAGVKDYSLEAATKDYRLALRMVLMNLSTVDQVDLGDGRGVALLRVWMERLLMRLQVDG